MSGSDKKKSRFSQEEIEIQEVLSENPQVSGQSNPGQSNPGQSNPAAPPPAELSTDCMTKLTHLLADSMGRTLHTVFKDFGFHNEDSEGSEAWSEGEDDEDDTHQELPTGRPSHNLVDKNNNSGKSLPNFGIVNEQNSEPGASGVGVSNSKKSDGPVDPEVVEPDKSLPSAITSRAPTNWYPHPEVLAWAVKEVDNCEWSPAVREIFESDFSPEAKFDHLFTAVSAPKEMLDAEQHPEIKKKDFLFKRFETEEFLHNANKDIVCGYRPLIEVLSNLRDVPGMENNRTLLAHVFQCMASAVTKLSRGRRELGRRFVPMENANALFRTTPSHYSFFGDASDDTAVTKAVAEAKVNKNLVLMPKKRKLSFRYSHPGGKFFYQSKDRYPNQNFRNNFYKRGGKGGQGKRGRFQGNRRKRNQNQQSNSKNSTQ